MNHVEETPLNEQEAIYFDALSRDRAESADTLDKPSMRGVRTSVVEKYSDQAHFIYELLQNADDAGATSARFVLRDDELRFAHDGTRRFTVSNPATEDGDSQNGTLGDINAITSIASSNKTAESKIGKFGVGFKAVFQYTQTPSVYDPNFRFKIERFIVPVRIDADHSERQPEETLFVFPFDHPERHQAEAYDDIYDKLRSLAYPVLYLTNLKVVSFECSGQLGLYSKRVEKEIELSNTMAQLVTLSQANGGDQDDVLEDKIWLCTRTSEGGHTYSVGFLLSDDGKLESTNQPASCFFSTKEATGLNFLIHAPFLLTDSREGIKAGEQHNRDMIQLLAKLAADTLTCLKTLGLVDDRIFDIVPYDESKFGDVDSRNRISFKPFYTAMKEAMAREPLLPSSDGFVTAEYAYWASVPEIAAVFSNERLAALCDDENAKWVFTSFGRDERIRSNPRLAAYIDAITKDWYDHDDVIGYITEDFIEAQPVEWLHQFYKYVAEASSRIKLIRIKPVFLSQDGKAVPAFDDKDQAVLFLPTGDSSGYETVNSALLENEETAAFIKQLGITPPSLKDEIYNKLLPQYQDDVDINTGPHFKKFFQYYKECSQTEAKSFVALLKDCEFVLYRSVGESEQVYRGKADTLYFPQESLRQWFAYKPNTRFVEWEEYLNLVGLSNQEDLRSFLFALGVKDEPKIFSRELSEQDASQIKQTWPYSSRDWVRKWTEPYIDGCQEIIEHATSDDSFAACTMGRLSSPRMKLVWLFGE